MVTLVAGTKYRGDFEERISTVIDAIADIESVILFIDEMHLSWNAGRVEGVMTDAATLSGLAIRAAILLWTTHSVCFLWLI